MTLAFRDRHTGSIDREREDILAKIGVSSFAELVEKCVPKSIGLATQPDLPASVSEAEILAEMRGFAQQNQIFANFIGFGYANTITPPVVQRNILENPGWYTAYTPYQAEISQGRLEALLNFQTMIADLTRLPIANASLLDEATAAAEAMEMFFRMTRDERRHFFVSEHIFPHTKDLILGRAQALQIECVVGDEAKQDFSQGFFGAIFQNPDQKGEIRQYSELFLDLKKRKIFVAIASDPLYLVWHEPEAADVILGNSQRFGVPLGYGGPHAAFFATTQEFMREIPGRIVGVSKDRLGQKGMRLSLQTREQHIRRERATSNICTAQALLAIMASMYAVYHGAKGLRKIAGHIQRHAQALAQGFQALGIPLVATESFFDTIALKINEADKKKIRILAEKNQMNFNYFLPNCLIIALGENVNAKYLAQILAVIATGLAKEKLKISNDTLNKSVATSATSGAKHTSPRKTEILTHPVFHSHRSETAMLRYMHLLEKKDLALNQAMIPLGSCTMKLNPTVAMMPITWQEFAEVHPFAPLEQNQGYQSILRELGDALCKITGFSGVALEPNSGAQGEYAGLMAIRAYFAEKGQSERNIVLIPNSAHGTNPASATKAGLKVVIIKCTESGDIDIEDLQKRIAEHQKELCCLMITYPSTHGVFEEKVVEICQMIHDAGGQVYMDGANMNAQVMLTNPAKIGADVCHINLHKTFSIPHGGGGPGMGPICVREHLRPFLSRHLLIAKAEDGPKSIAAMAAAPWGSALILLISYITIRALGKQGLYDSTCMAIANANYLKKMLETEYSILYTGKNDFVAHEFILDCREFKQKCGIEVEDIAKRLIDYGFHAPTMSWPVAGTMMIEPTESEPKRELDRFCEAMTAIRKELLEIEEGKVSREDNVLKNAPHPAFELCDDKWQRAYSRRTAAYPIPSLLQDKYWPPIARVDNAWGDRNIFCVCPPIADATDSSGSSE